MRLIGLDPGLRLTGWGVIDVDGNRLRHVAHGVIKVSIEGSLALFLLPAAASDNRPLTLHIPGATGEDAEVTLDL